MDFKMCNWACPKCGGDDLYVVSGTFTGRIPLSEDGFAFSDAAEISTEDEEVQCGSCGHVFPLSTILA